MEMQRPCHISTNSTEARTFVRPGWVLVALAGVALGFVGPSQGARAQTPRWTASEVVRMARSRAASVRVARRKAALAGARTATTGLRANPRANWYREQAFAASNTSQDILSVTWPVDFSGQRSGQRALARADEAQARAQAELAERRAVGRALRLFYEAVASRKRVDVMKHQVDALGTVERILKERAAAGKASGYMQKRFGLEAELARSKLADRRRELRAKRMRLQAFVAIDEDARPRLEGQLTTDAPPPLKTLMARARAQHPALDQARHAEAAAEDARVAGRTSWIPTLRFMGGYNAMRARGTAHGYVVGLGVELPVFARGQSLRQRAQARERVAAARNHALVRTIRRNLRQARSRLVAVRKQLTRFDEQTRARVEELLHGARVSYREGRRSVMEILDARRMATRVRERRIELALEGKRAEITLREHAGGWS